MPWLIFWLDLPEETALTTIPCMHLVGNAGGAVMAQYLGLSEINSMRPVWHTMAG